MRRQGPYGLVDQNGVCQHFLRGTCYFGDRCNYIHPGGHATPSDPGGNLFSNTDSQPFPPPPPSWNDSVPTGPRSSTTDPSSQQWLGAEQGPQVAGSDSRPRADQSFAPPIPAHRKTCPEAHAYWDLADQGDGFAAAEAVVDVSPPAFMPADSPHGSLREEKLQSESDNL